ncbi:MAG TPA: acetyl-CoA carboxylase biotin carboxyl carrier protein subunit [Salinivirgaceae bacterium]|nr:acetyl-CoA carboxylase biotin carboxyl carrier protein subunit [Salinivirgaceae bacterium]
MKSYSFTINGQKYDVQIKSFEENIAEIEVNGSLYKVELNSEIKKTKTPTLVRKPVENKPGEGTIKKVASTGGYQLKAPLPGNIFKILVHPGDTISKGQTVLVMEAMKMENNIQVDRDGVVKEIKVKVGDAVLQNDVLMIIE